MTTSGGDPNQPCAIPFIYRGLRYSGCTLTDAADGRAWCSTLVDGNGVHVSGRSKWGHCPNRGCPEDLGERFGIPVYTASCTQGCQVLVRVGIAVSATAAWRVAPCRVSGR